MLNHHFSCLGFRWPMECIFPDWMVLIKLSTVKISCKVNINIMPLKDYFLPLYGFCPIWGALSQNISGWVMDLRLLRHLCWHFKGDTWDMKFWTRGRNFLFQNVTARGFRLLCHHAQETARFFFLICVIYSLLVAPVTTGVFFLSLES